MVREHVMMAGSSGDSYLLTKLNMTPSLGSVDRRRIMTSNVTEDDIDGSGTRPVALVNGHH